VLTNAFNDPEHADVIIHMVKNLDNDVG